MRHLVLAVIHVMLLKPQTYNAETDEGEFQEAILFYAFCACQGNIKRIFAHEESDEEAEEPSSRFLASSTWHFV